jgi:DNA-binding LacI/PurR family transcriptional regulator
LAPATITDVARLANVSPTTVSHVLNGKGRVKEATRQQVLAAAARLDYNPSRAARALRTKRNGTVAFLIPSFEAPATLGGRLASLDVYMSQATAAAQAAFVEDHALVLLPPTASASDLHRQGIDGGIICDPAADERLVTLFESMELPIVTIERQPDGPGSEWFVGADNTASTRLLLDHMEEQGARRIALISVDLPIAWALECRAAYDSWAMERGMEPLVVGLSPHDPQRTAYSVANRVLDDPRPPDAVVALDERFPSGVIRAAGDRDLAIPGDLMIATGIDSHEARAATPSVTAIDIHPDVQGTAAVGMLLARLRGTSVEAPQITRTTLNVRDSTLRNATPPR